MTRPHEGGEVTFAPQGSVLASARDDEVRLWETTNEPIGEPFVLETGSVHGVAFSPDGTLLATLGSDGLLLWDATWSPARACELAAPSVRRAQLEQYLPDGAELRACTDID